MSEEARLRCIELLDEKVEMLKELKLLREQLASVEKERDELQEHFDAQCVSADVLFDSLADMTKGRDNIASSLADEYKMVEKFRAFIQREFPDARILK